MNVYHSLFIAICFCLVVSVFSACPYSESGLLTWNSAASWPSGTVPAANSDVVIGAGKKIVLNVSPPVLKSITVDGGLLVWGNVDNIEVITGALIIKNNGQLWIGSEDCLFTKNATITLTGTPASTNFTGFGNKVLGVGANGTLELHGAAYTPTWTKLASTHIGSIWKAPTVNRGMNVAILNPSSGSLVEYKVFDTFSSTAASTNLTAFLTAQTTGVVVAVVCADECSSRLTPDAVAALQGIGSVKVTQLKYRSGWACVGVKGAANATASEDLRNETSRPTAIVTRVFANFAVNAQASSPYGGLIEVVSTPATITLAQAVNWRVGQKIVISSSDNDYTHAEENEIVAVVSSTQLKLKNAFRFVHWGSFENGVDERAEVGLLSRSILIRGSLSNSTDTYGGHSRFLVNFTNIHIENVEYFQMGQDGVVGSYPIHFHMTFDVDAVGKYTKPAYVKGCSIWRSFNRCLTIHGTSGLLAKDNVAHDNLGHCYFFEDGSEMRNTLDHNLGLTTKYGNTILSDYNPSRCTGVLSGFCKGPATFWLENANNTLINNVAGGSVAFGIWYVFPAKPTGLSAPYFPNLAIPYIPLGVCRNNTAHSSPNGVMIDDGVDGNPANPTYLGIVGARYRPHVTSSLSSPRVIANFDDFTVHHSSKQGIWARGGDFRFNRARLADNIIGITLASEGTMPNDPGSSQEVYNSIIVGITRNNFSALITSRIKGYEVYDGPVRAINCTFINFPNTNTNSSPIAAKSNNVWQIATTNDVAGATFTNVFKNVFYQTPVSDGDRNNIFKDIDGSVTGKVGWNVITDHPIHTTKRCEVRPLYQAVLCPDKYGMLYIINRNVSGTNYTGWQPRLVLYRDEKSTSPLTLTGISGTPPAQFQPLVLVNKSYTLHFAHASPPALSIQLTNFNLQDFLRIGICYPSNTNFTVRYKRGNVFATLTKVASLAAVDSNTNVTSSYFFDNTNGLLFVKMVATYGRNGLEYCGSGGCESIEIAATGPNLGQTIGTCPGAYPLYAKTEP